MISMPEFWTLYAVVLATMLVCRCVPMLALRGRQVPARVSAALEMIPVAAYAALVANDLFSPTMFDGGVWEGLVPLVASAGVVVVARKTGSLVWCAVAGVAFYVLLGLL
jgi:branched-subunit amino acid transport protein